MKITLYTINDCKFSQAEKQYLTSKNMQFEEKNLETNREFLTEMLNISNNFAGTPVTKIEKDDGTTVVLKGFTQSEFDTALGLQPADMSAGTEAKPTEVTTETTAPTMGSMNTAAVAQATTDTMSSMNQTPPVSAATTEPAMPSMDTPMSSSPAMPSMNQPAPVSAMPVDTSSDPVAANPTEAIPMPMGNPLSDTTPSVPTTPDLNVAPQGEVIPSTPSLSEPVMPSPSMNMGDTTQNSMGTMPQSPDMSMGQTPSSIPSNDMNQAPAANDPLNSVLNDLQTKSSS